MQNTPLRLLRTLAMLTSGLVIASMGTMTRAAPMQITIEWSIAGGTFAGAASNSAFTATVTPVANSGTLTLYDGQPVTIQIQDWSWSVNVSAEGVAEYAADRLLTLDSIAQTIDQNFRLTSGAFSSLFGGYPKSGKLLDSTVLTYDFGSRGKVDVKMLYTQTPSSTFTLGTSAGGLISQGHGALAQFTAYDIVPEPASLALLTLGGLLCIARRR